MDEAENSRINNVTNNCCVGKPKMKPKTADKINYRLFFNILNLNYEAVTTPLKERVLGVLLSLVVTFTVFTKAPAFAAL